MPLQKIQFKPGIVRDLTAYTTEGGWFDGNLVRFRLGFPQSVGGWQRFSVNTFLGVCRSLLGWNTLSGEYFMGVGTSLKFYIENGGAYYDVTPIRRDVTLTKISLPTTGASGTGTTATITFATQSSAASVGSSVTVTGVTPTGYNGTFTTTATSTSSVSYARTTTGSQTVAGRIQVALGPFTATNGSNLITVYDVGHGCTTGDFVTFSGATGLGGNITAAVLNQEYQVYAVIDGDNYQITATATANSSDTGHGVSVNAKYQINTGLDNAVSGAGWGAGTWGRGTWGSSVALDSGNTLRLWSQDTWGEDLIFNVHNGGIYYWQSRSGTALQIPPTTNPATRAVSIASLSTDPTCPTLATQVLVSDRDRHLIAFGPDNGTGTDQDPMLIRWSNQEDYTVWYPEATNSAGDLRLGTGSHIVRAVETKREILVFTDTAMYSMQFIGPPYTYGIQQVSTNTTTIAYNGFAVVEDNVIWMGLNKFYIYAGSTDELPCTVKNYVFDNINRSQADKIFASVNSEFNEITWFYPSANATENDSYVTYNYAEKAWTYGLLSRTAWLDRGVLDYPVAASTDGYLYYHEYGNNDGSQNPPVAINAYIESAPFDIGEGDQFSFIRRIIPDITFVNSTDSPTAAMTLKMQNFPGSDYSQASSSSVVQSATVPVEQFTQQAFVRLRGRQATFKVESDKVNTRWILGSPRLEIQPDGRR